MDEIEITGNANIKGSININGNLTSDEIKCNKVDAPNVVTYGVRMALTNRAMGNHESIGKYIGLCGHTATCPNYVGYNLIPGNHETPPGNSWVTI